MANLGDGDGGTDICRQRKTPPHSECARRAATPCAIISHHLRHSHAYWIEYCHRWLLEHGLSADRVRQRVYVWTPRLVLSSAGRLMCICAVCRSYDDDELAHYSLATTDLEYKFVVSSAAWHCHRCGATTVYSLVCVHTLARYWFGWGELWGIANRGSYDLERHTEGSGLDLRFKDPTTQQVCRKTLGW